MRFVYEYRTSDNAHHTGIVIASDREAAFAALKAKGIRPAGMKEAPGFFNKLFGKGKRWMAIAVLSLVVVAVIGVNASLHRRLATVADPLCDERSQIYGEPGVLKSASADCWAAVFSDCGDRYLALHAVPGRYCECSGFRKTNETEIVASLRAVRQSQPVPEDDYEEVKKIRRIVNGMRKELADYLEAGGDVAGYMERVEERTMSEIHIYDRIRREILNSKDALIWRARNAELRALGLPMVSVEKGGKDL